MTAQKICKSAKDEDDVRGILQVIWKNPEKSSGVLAEAIERNRDVYVF